MSSAGGSKPKVNLRSTAVKRIMQEAAELADPDEDDFVAAPLETDIFEWHCTVRGVQGTEYEGGLYHLRILLPPTYPMSAPDIILLTPNGRFELGKKICIDGLTSFHAGSWQPAWGVRTAILGLRSFWTQTGEALSAIGALDMPKEERRRLAKLSADWICPTCGVPNRELISPQPSSSAKNANHAPHTETADESSRSAGATALVAGGVGASTGPAQAQGGNASSGQTDPDRNLPEDAHTQADTLSVDRTSNTAASSAPSAEQSELRHRLNPRSAREQPTNINANPPSATPDRSASTAAAQLATVAAPSLATLGESGPSRRRTLVWMDIGIFVLSSLLFYFIARRMARSGPLDDLDQA